MSDPNGAAVSVTAGGAALTAGVVLMTVSGAGIGVSSSDEDASADSVGGGGPSGPAGDDASGAATEVHNSRCSVSQFSIMGAFLSAIKA